MFEKVVYKLNMLICPIRMNKIYIVTCVGKCKLGRLEDDERRCTEEEKKKDFENGINMTFIKGHDG